MLLLGDEAGSGVQDRSGMDLDKLALILTAISYSLVTTRNIYPYTCL